MLHHRSADQYHSATRRVPLRSFPSVRVDVNVNLQLAAHAGISPVTFVTPATHFPAPICSNSPARCSPVWRNFFATFWTTWTCSCGSVSLPSCGISSHVSPPAFVNKRHACPSSDQEEEEGRGPVEFQLVPLFVGCGFGIQNFHRIFVGRWTDAPYSGGSRTRIPSRRCGRRASVVFSSVADVHGFWFP